MFGHRLARRDRPDRRLPRPGRPEPRTCRSPSGCCSAGRSATSSTASGSATSSTSSTRDRGPPVLHVQRGRRGDQRGRSCCSSRWRSFPALAGWRERDGGWLTPAVRRRASARSLRVPRRAVRARRPLRRRRHRPVAELRPEAHLRRPADGRPAAPLRANAIVGPGTELRLDVPPTGRARPGARAGDPAPRRLRGRRPADRRQAGGPRRPPVAGPRRRHARQRPARPHGDGSTYGGIAGVQRPGIVHRLDRDTSGLLMVARHDAAQALAHGPAQGAPGQEDLPRARPGQRGRRGRADRGADRARSRSTARGWRSSPTGGRRRPATGSASGSTGWTLLELDLVTGRTHQIRVHLEAIGHPVAGDPVYGTGTSRRGPGRPRAAVPARLAARAHLAVRRPPHPGGGAAPAGARVGARRRCASVVR